MQVVLLRTPTVGLPKASIFLFFVCRSFSLSKLKRTQVLWWVLLLTKPKKKKPKFLKKTGSWKQRSKWRVGEEGGKEARNAQKKGNKKWLFFLFFFPFLSQLKSMRERPRNQEAFGWDSIDWNKLSSVRSEAQMILSSLLQQTQFSLFLFSSLRKTKNLSCERILKQME